MAVELNESVIRPVPPASFCKKLYHYDKDLRITWCTHVKAWQIWFCDPDTQELSHVMNVVEPDGTARDLDDRVFVILDKNKYYAQHPEEMQADFVDAFTTEVSKDQLNRIEDLKHLSKDRALKRQFEKIREMASRIDKNELTTSRYLKNLDGTPALGIDGKPVMYVPHESLLK